MKYSNKEILLRIEEALKHGEKPQKEKPIQRRDVNRGQIDFVAFCGVVGVFFGGGLGFCGRKRTSCFRRNQKVKTEHERTARSEERRKMQEEGESHGSRGIKETILNWGS